MGAGKVGLIKDSTTRQEAIEHLFQDLDALEIMLQEGMFETDVQRIGAEQEMHFIGKNWQAAPVGPDVLDLLEDDHYTTEFARFNLEANLDPILFENDCFSTLEANLEHFVRKADTVAQQFDAKTILAGILPTIRLSDIDLQNLTPQPRYKLLIEVLKKLRHGTFDFHIEGTDQLIVKFDHALFEGTTASFQLHYQVAPEDFVASYNWAQALAAPVLAAATNSPILLGRRLWQETRIVLFQQSIDIRNDSERIREQPQRVSFGTDWLHNSVLDYYKNDIVRYRTFLISNRKENAVEVLEKGGIPKLYALNVHNGTIYKWNRACYGVTNGKPHLRIENRVLPSGPTPVDEAANAAFWFGLMKGMPDKYAFISDRMAFDNAKANFIRAARQGLRATFHWPDKPKGISARDLIINELLPIAKTGLEKARVQEADISRFLGIIEERVKSGYTGSHWILSSFESLKKKVSKHEALLTTTASFYKQQMEGKPVHTWRLATPEDGGGTLNRYYAVEQIMTTDLFTVLEDELIDYVAKIMTWKNVRHIPVENKEGELVGIIDAKSLLQHYSRSKNNGYGILVKDMMIKDFVSIYPEMNIEEAIDLLKEKKVTCLPVVKNKHLIGLVTDRDFLGLTKILLNELAEFHDEEMNQ